MFLGHFRQFMLEIWLLELDQPFDTLWLETSALKDSFWQMSRVQKLPFILTLSLALVVNL